MKKSLMIIAIGLMGTTVFAQNAKSDLPQKEIRSQDQKSNKLKHKLAVKETKSTAEIKSAPATKKVDGKKMEMHNPRMKAKLEDK